MRNIVVVQCKSTGINYIQDIIDRNCNPVILEMNAFSDTEEAEMHLKEVRSGYNLINADYDLIYEKDTYEETLEIQDRRRFARPHHCERHCRALCS